MLAETLIYSKLTANLSLLTYIGGTPANTKISPGVAPEHIAPPYITYNTISNVPTNSKGVLSATNDINSNVEVQRVQVSCFGTQYDQVITMSLAVKKQLQNLQNTSITTSYSIVGSRTIGFETCIFESEQDDYEKKAGAQGIFSRHLDFIVRTVNIT